MKIKNFVLIKMKRNIHFYQMKVKDEKITKIILFLKKH